MTDASNIAAGERSPAARVFGPNWRERRDKPAFRVELWPNQSLTRPGSRWFFGISAGMLCMPLAAVGFTPVFWGLIPFLALAFWAIWYAIRRNARNLQITETLSIWRDEMRVERREPNGRVLRWQADPMRVRVRLHQDARLEDYLTLIGAGREIELGAFLSPEERVALADEIEHGITRALGA